MDIKMLHPDTPITEVEQLADIVNRVYKEAEKGIWSDGQVRTDAAEIKRLAEKEELAIARVNGEIAGCVRISQVDTETGEFGILAVDKSRQGAGVGRALVEFAEEAFRQAELSVMQIKVLTPQEGTASFPSKANLIKWYTKQGYQETGIELIDNAVSQLSIKLALPCQFIVYRKKIR